jgi:hypothetical protein
VLGALALELHGQRRDLQLEVVDQPQADVNVAAPRIGDLEAVEQLAAGVTEQVADRARVARRRPASRGCGSSAWCGDLADDGTDHCGRLKTVTSNK